MADSCREVDCAIQQAHDTTVSSRTTKSLFKHTTSTKNYGM